LQGGDVAGPKTKEVRYATTRPRFGPSPTGPAADERSPGMPGIGYEMFVTEPNSKNWKLEIHHDY
jgi:hypothetical protein